MAIITTPLKLESFNNRFGAKILTPHTRVRATIYPQPNDLVFRGRSTEKIVGSWIAEESPDITVRSMRWQKQLGTASGQWTVVLKEKPKGKSSMVDGTILPDDWVEIEMMRNGVIFPICTGIVKTAFRRQTTVGGATVTLWDMTGVDHGGLAEFPITFQNLFLRTLSELVKGLFTERIRGKIGGSPAEMFEVLIRATFSPGTQTSPWTLPPSLRARHQQSVTGFLDLLKLQLDETRGAYHNEIKLWTQPGENLYQTIKDWCNPLLNEFIWDVDPDSGIPTATIRERPFPLTEHGLDSPWFDMPMTEIPKWAVKDVQVGRSSAERFNLFQLVADPGLGLTDSEQIASSPPLWSRKSIEQFGIRSMQEKTKYIQFGDDEQQGGWIEERDRQQTAIRDWHALNPWFLSGTIPVPWAAPEVRVGTRLRLTEGNESTDETYYVEGVGLDYTASEGASAPHRAQSTFSVTRGWRGSDTSLITALLDVTGEFQRAI